MPAPVKKHLLVIRATKVRLAPWQDTPLKTILTDPIIFTSDYDKQAIYNP